MVHPGTTQQQTALHWRPIEEAPWSGPPVLLWKEITKEHYVAARVRGEHGPGWCTPDGFQIFGASRWMPLPEPPLDCAWCGNLIPDPTTATKGTEEEPVCAACWEGACKTAAEQLLSSKPLSKDTRHG